MSAVQCDYLDTEGRCEGMYKGFGCIEDKCRQESKIKPKKCVHLRGDGFCEKLGKLNCIGETDCADFIT